MMSRFTQLLLLTGILCGTAAAQSWDNSGNGLLSGQYYMRQVVWVLEDDYGDLVEGGAFYGVITFDGNGNYTFNGTMYDPSVVNTNTGQQTYTTSGTYVISASGYGYITSPINSAYQISDYVYGLVSNGIFIGSSTENASYYNDMLIAAPIGSTEATNATLSGNYAIADIDNPYIDYDEEASEGYGEGSFGIYARDSLTTFTANGSGTLSSVTANGYIGVNSGSVTNQSIGSVKYSFSNGAGNIFFSGSYGVNNIGSTLLVSDHYVYISPDGNFIFGGSPTGVDMFVGTRVGSGSAQNFNGLYYQAGMDVALTEYGTDPDSYYGSFYANAGGVQGQGLAHQRLAEWIYNGNPVDLNFADAYTFQNGDASDAGTNYPTGQSYVFGNNGAIRIGFGQIPAQSAYLMGISVALAAPNLSGPGVYLNPSGILNASSSALFTSGLSPGELVILNGTGLSSSTVVTSNFGSSLNGVQVMMNGIAAPIYYVSPTAISAIVPYEVTPGDVINIQVINNQQSSNTISAFAQNTEPGAFTDPPGGIGNAIAQHTSNYALVTSSSPAQPGETIVVYVNGLGPVSPSIIDGTASGSNPPSASTNTFEAFIGGVQATVSYSGLVPGVIALYQMNIVVPSGVAAGNANLDFAGLVACGTSSCPESYTTEAILPVSATAAAVPAAVSARLRHNKPRFKKYRQGSQRHPPEPVPFER